MIQPTLNVCKLVRNKHFKAIKNKDKRVGFTKNQNGWHYGMKVHIAINRAGFLTATHISKASDHDVRHVKKLTSKQTKTVVGDSHYGGRPITREFKELGIRVVSNAHKLRTSLEDRLLAMRSYVETVIGNLKDKLKLETSYPKSYEGYIFHYLKVLLGYQIRTIFRG